MNIKDNRPKFLNLLKIRLPITGIASICHRLSGLVLFLAIPFSLYLLQLSLTDSSSFSKMLDYLTAPIVKLGLIILTWSFIHHLFAGFRFLLIDQNIGITLSAARKTALYVVVLTILATFIIIGVWVV